MTRPAATTIKVNPVRGVLPVLQYALPQQLLVDDEYQRSIDNEKSRALIRRIATHWDWSLCQPLAVSRRPDTGELFVIDGQHRLMAARLRGDIAQLPCVIGEYCDRSAEAAAFVSLNQERRPLDKLDIFKAAVAAGDDEANGIVAALAAAGLTLAPHSNHTAWKPGMVSNIGGIQRAWRAHGPTRTQLALTALARGLDGQVLRYAGSIFPGVVAIVALETQGMSANDIEQWGAGEIAPILIDMINGASQAEWRAEMARARGDNPNLKFAAASAQVLLAAWNETLDAFFEDDEVTL